MKLPCLTPVDISFPPLKQACWQGARLLTRLKSKCRFRVQGVGEPFCNPLFELMTTILLLHRNASSSSEKMLFWRLPQTSGDMKKPNFICYFHPSLQSLFDSAGFCLLNPCNVLPSSQALAGAQDMLHKASIGRRPSPALCGLARPHLVCSYFLLWPFQVFDSLTSRIFPGPGRASHLPPASRYALEPLAGAKIDVCLKI